MKQKTVASLRDEIDELDEGIVTLLNKRAALALQVGAQKGSRRIYRPAREAEVLIHVAKVNSGTLPLASLRSIYGEIITACRNVQLSQDSISTPPDSV